MNVIPNASGIPYFVEQAKKRAEACRPWRGLFITPSMEVRKEAMHRLFDALEADGQPARMFWPSSSVSTENAYAIFRIEWPGFSRHLQGHQYHQISGLVYAHSDDEDRLVPLLRCEDQDDMRAYRDL